MNKLWTSPRAQGSFPGQKSFAGRAALSILIIATIIATLVLIPGQARDGLLSPLLPSVAYANPTGSELFIPEVRIGDSTFRLSTDKPSIPTNGKYSYTVEITPDSALKSVTLRFELYRENEERPFHYFTQGVTIPRPDAAVSELNRGSASSTGGSKPAATRGGSAESRGSRRPQPIRQVLERKNGQGLENLGMGEGVYRVACVITATTNEGKDAATLRDLLVVYDPSIETHKILPVLHFNALSERRADGVFLSDPSSGLFEARRAAIEATAQWVSGDEQVYLTLALSPLMLEEIALLGEGYSYVNGGGAVVEVPAEDARAVAGKRTVEALRAALATGRLSITMQGYSDPNLGALQAVGLDDDVDKQYELGIETLERVLSTDVATITAPWRSSLSKDTVDRLLEINPEMRFIIDPNTGSFIESSKAEEPQTISYRHGTDGQILINSTYIGDYLTETDTESLIGAMLDLRNSSLASVMLLECSGDVDRLSTITTNLVHLSRYEWLQTISPQDDTFNRDNSRSMRGNLEFLDEPLISKFPDALSPGIQELVKARQQASGLEAMLVEPSEEEASDIGFVRLISLRATAGSSLEFFDNYEGELLELKSPSRALAQASLERSEKWFEPLDIKTQPITFSGSGGKLPITIINGTQSPLSLEVRLIPAGSADNPNMSITPAEFSQIMRPNETFLEPTVELRNIISGTVKVQLLAGNYVVCEETVRVSATFADRIAIIVIVALAGTALTIYVWRRIKKAEGTRLVETDESPLAKASVTETKKPPSEQEA